MFHVQALIKTGLLSRVLYHMPSRSVLLVMPKGKRVRLTLSEFKAQYVY